MRVWIWRSLFAISWAIFLLVLPVFSGSPITGWNVIAALGSLIVFYPAQVWYDRKRKKPTDDR